MPSCGTAVCGFSVFAGDNNCGKFRSRHSELFVTFACRSGKIKRNLFAFSNGCARLTKGTVNEMKIEIREKGSEAFYRETVNVLSQYRALLKQPGRPLRDNFKLLRNYTAACAVLAAAICAISIAWGADSITISMLMLLLAAAVFCALYLRNLNRLLRDMMNDSHTSLLTLDEQGVELAKEGSKTVRMAWDGVAFVRVFDESVAFLAQDGTGFIIFIDRRYEGEITQWLRANLPGVRLLQKQ